MGDTFTRKPLKVISWNIYNVQHYKKDRVKAIGDILTKENADIVLLQEVTDHAANYFDANLPGYECIYARGDKRNAFSYYTAILLKKSRVTCEHHDVTPFTGTIMKRNLLSAVVTIEDMTLLVVTAHLESGEGRHIQQRLEQLQTAFRMMLDAKEEYPVIFAGDMNLRDGMLTTIGGFPPGIHDMWISCGRHKDTRFSWDSTINDNYGAPCADHPRNRFDRIYFRNASTSQIVPVKFGLLGLDRIRNVRCFPSDHWGIMGKFELTTKSVGKKKS